MGRKLLTFDVGNTRVKAALFDGREMVVRKSLVLGHSDDLAETLNAQFVSYGVPDRCFIASVVRGAEVMVHQAVQSVWDMAPRVVDAQMDLGLEIAVPRPDMVGIDRLLEASEAHHIVKGAVVVAAFGSAITVDLVTEDGVFCGGTIAPGLRLGLKSLHQEASLLPEVELIRPESAIGIDTRSCMQAGVVYGAAGGVERLFEEMAPDGKAKLVLTGGDADLIGHYIRVPYQLEEDLVLRGLVSLDQRLQKK